MPCLGTFSDIGTIQPSLQAHLLPLGSHAKILPNPWIQSSCYTGHLHVRRRKVLITAVATLETKQSAHKGKQASNSDDDQNGSGDDGEELEQVDDRERLRRMRISKANRGNTPWNKGRKHSPETLQKIRERTKIAMQDPKVKLKLANLGHAQDKETRIKIGQGVRMRWARRKERRKVQETCQLEWQNLLAEAAKKGLTDEEELQWNSYKILDQQNQLEWLESVEQRKAAKGIKSNRRAPKSPEQRRKIAEAIAAKWADPSYREKVCSGLAKYHGIPADSVGRPRRRPSSNTEPRKKNPTTKKTTKHSDSDSETIVKVVKVRKRRTPVYKDPLASSKLEMIKSIRAKRVAEETNKMDAVERARLLISEAEKAAKVLEIAAVKSPVARASLLESRKLIAEATELIESIEMGQITEDDVSDINGTHALLFNGDLGNFEEDSEDIEVETSPHPNGTRVVYPLLESNGAIKLNGSEVCHGTEEKVSALELGNVTKKWVRGRLVVVTEEV